MKDIKIELYFSRERKYHISLDRYSYINFKTKLEAENYLRKFRKVLRENVSQLQVINSQVYTLYSLNYLQFDALTTEKIDENFSIFGKTYHRIFYTFSQGNQTTFVFKNIDFCFSILLDIVYGLRDYGQKHKNYVLTNQSRSNLKFIKALQKEYNLDKKNVFLSHSSENNVISIKKLKKTI